MKDSFQSSYMLLVYFVAYYAAMGAICKKGAWRCIVEEALVSVYVAISSTFLTVFILNRCPYGNDN